MENRYCPICGKRREQPKSTTIYETSEGTMTVNYYVTNHTEPICYGHRSERVAVPKAFYDAFREEELL